MADFGDRGIEQGRSFAGAPFHVEALRPYLEGSWKIIREVHQVGEGNKASFEGIARFSPIDGDTMNYNEQGNLETPEGVFAASRDYTYRFIGGGLAEVRFSDGKFFHVLDLGKGLVQVEHVCGDDTYRGLFRAVDEDTWLSVWRVEGPRKSHVISTRYYRDNSA